MRKAAHSFLGPEAYAQMVLLMLFIVAIIALLLRTYEVNHKAATDVTARKGDR